MTYPEPHISWQPFTYALMALLSLVILGMLIWSSISISQPVQPMSVEYITVDDCEYIVNRVHGGIVLTHKGSCTNVIHRSQE